MKKRGTLFVLLAWMAGSMVAQVDTMHVKGLTLSEEQIALEQGDIYQLKATVDPDNATNRSRIYWYGDDIAGVDQNGLVTGREVGKTKVTALIEGWAKSCVVEVKATEWPVIKGAKELPLVEAGDQLEMAFNFALKEGKLHLNGTFVGNACHPSQLRYEIYKHTIYLSLDINYSDTCWTAGERAFCQQAIDVTLDNCPSDSYTVYMESLENWISADPASATRQVRSIKLNLGTQVLTPTLPMESDAPMYDLQGRRVSQPTKGLYIQNGRKRIIP